VTDNVKLDAAAGRLVGAVDAARDGLIALSDRIGNTPELGLQEEKASSWHADALKQTGFDVEKPYAGMPTAFRAELAGSGPGPTLALLVEYDALPDIGHACGHNLHGVMSTGAALALAQCRTEWPGRLIVLGSPAEEGAVDGAGGKVVLVEAGAFEGVDAAMMVHASTRNILGMPSLAREAFEISFRGKPAHAAAIPHEGVNALDAALLTFNAVNALRQHLTQDVRIHGIITKGGVSPNIVPEYAEIRMYARAADAGYLADVVEKVKNCARGAAQATGAKMAWRATAHPYKNMVASKALVGVFAGALKTLGAPVHDSPQRGSGSTDMGNVSQVVPSIHPYISISDSHVAGHSREFAACAVSPRGHEGLILGTKALALTALRVFNSPEAVRAMKDEFAASM
jgi:amidohydrolase